MYKLRKNVAFGVAVLHHRRNNDRSNPDVEPASRLAVEMSGIEPESERRSLTGLTSSNDLSSPKKSHAATDESAGAWACYMNFSTQKVEITGMNHTARDPLGRRELHTGQ